MLHNLILNYTHLLSHVLWECSAYSSTRASFMKKLQELLEDDYEDFESLVLWAREHKLCCTI